MLLGAEEAHVVVHDISDRCVRGAEDQIPHADNAGKSTIFVNDVNIGGRILAVRFRAISELSNDVSRTQDARNRDELCLHHAAGSISSVPHKAAGNVRIVGVDRL
jgi:hypothetical protein